MAVVENTDGIVQINSAKSNQFNLVGNIKLYSEKSLDYATIYKTQHEVRTVIDFLSRNISQIPLHAYEKQSDNGRVRSSNDALVSTLDQPDLYTTRSRFFEFLVKDLCIYDEAIRLKVKGDNGRIALVRIPPSLVTIVGDNWLRPEKYRITGKSGVVEYTPEQVIHIHGYDPTDLRRGLSPLETLRQLLGEQQAASEHREMLWRQGARAALVIERPLGAPTWSDTARSRFKHDWDSSYSGVNNAGKTAVLEEGMIAKPLETFSARDSQYFEASQLAREVVASAYGVPAGLLGLGNVNYSSLTEQHRQLYQDCLAPYLTILQEEFEIQLLPEFNAGKSTYLEFQLQEKLRGSFEEQAAVLQASVGAPYLTRNEARARLNLSSIDGGDELVTPLNVLIGGLASPQDTAPKALENTIEVKKGLDIEVKAISRNLMTIKKAGVKELNSVFIKSFERQRNSIKSRVGSKSFIHGAKADAYFDTERFDAELANDITPVITKIASKAGSTLGNYDVVGLTNWLESVSLAQAKSINNSTYTKINDALASLEYEDPLKAVDAVFDELTDNDYSGSTLSMVGTVISFSRTDSAKFNNKATKTWIVTSGNPRSTHALLDGETVNIDDLFSNGAKFPGDPSLDVSDRANCECIVDFGG
jgi:HK97 family phage portal protein